MNYTCIKTFVDHLKNKHKVGGLLNERQFLSLAFSERLNYHISNLEIVSPSENKKHAFRIGLMSQKGEKHAGNKLNSKQVMDIFISKDKVQVLADKYGLKSSVTISNIRTGKCWSHLTGKKYEKK